MKFLWILMLSVPLVGSGQMVFAPNAQQNQFGNGASAGAFDIGIGTARYQEVFGASQFSGLGSGGGYLTTLAFRLADGLRNGEGFITTFPSIQINFSTTAKGPDQLSSVFAQNIGSDEMVALARGPLAMNGVHTGPESWASYIHLTQPFYYDPSAGNLLMDIRNYGGGIAKPLDAQSIRGDSVSSVWTHPNLGGSVDSVSGNLDTGGLVVQFFFVPVPEPSTWALLAMSSVIVTVVYKRRQSR